MSTGKSRETQIRELSISFTLNPFVINRDEWDGCNNEWQAWQATQFNGTRG
jgi:hypothetical protein